MAITGGKKVSQMSKRDCSAPDVVFTLIYISGCQCHVTEIEPVGLKVVIQSQIMFQTVTRADYMPVIIGVLTQSGRT